MNREEEQEAVVAALLVDVVRPLLQQLQGATANGAAARANLAQQLHEALLNDDDDAADDVIENYVYRGGNRVDNARNAIIDDSVRGIHVAAFQFSQYLTDVEFGNMLLIIGPFAFFNCIVLRGIQIPSVRRLEENSFSGCRQLEYAEFGVDLEYVGQRAFTDCPSLQRITVPLKDNITFDRGAFKCDNLTTVNLVGADELQKTISSLHMERWKNEINQEINRINRVLPGLEDWEKTSEIQEWLERVRRSFNRYKSEHQVIVKEAITLLELALWKAKLLEEKGEIEEANLEFQPKKKAKMDVDSARKALRITSGANVIIKNVLPFLKLA